MDVSIFPGCPKPTYLSASILADWQPSAISAREPFLETDDGSVSKCLAFEDCLLEPSRRALTRQGTRVLLGDRAFDILVTLIARSGQVVSKEDLFAAVWPDTTVEESNIRVHIAALRKALGDEGRRSRIIACVTGRGYAFVGKIGRDVSYRPRREESVPLRSISNVAAPTLHVGS